MSEDDVHLAEKLLEAIPACPNDPNKAERVLGYASKRLAREKALRTLGTTEEQVDTENSKILGSLGIEGRRRSYSMLAQSNNDLLAFANAARPRRMTVATMIWNFGSPATATRRRNSSYHPKTRPRYKNKRRSSESSLRRLLKLEKERSADRSAEIDALKARVDALEKMLSRSGGLVEIDVPSAPMMIES